MINQHGHGGNLSLYSNLSGLPATEILDFSANINPFGPPPWLAKEIETRLPEICHYPDADASALTLAASDYFDVPPSHLVFANGSEEILHALPHALKRNSAIIPTPSYIDYEKTALRGMAVRHVPLLAANQFAPNLDQLEAAILDDEVIYLGNPNNPTGQNLNPSDFVDLIHRHPNAIFVIDEAFAAISEHHQSFIPLKLPNVIILFSLTKSHAIPGLRIGGAIADPSHIAQIKAELPLWNVNVLSQAVATRAFNDDTYLPQSRDLIRTERAFLYRELNQIPQLHAFPSNTNFLLVQIHHGETSSNLAKSLLSQGIAIRDASNFHGLDDSYFRIAVRTRRENLELIHALREAFHCPIPRQPKPRKTPALMLQGTSSNAGKSILATALCRILHQDGLRVAPFKSQNISLNSYVTADGAEIGRAQALQAQACHLNPCAAMNPILVKPAGTHGSQIILMGKAIGHMSIKEFTKFKPTAFQTATAAYDEWSKPFDAMILEGAGSPAEVNLKHHDISNMAMAKHARARVLMVGDIDRGGIFASFLGSMHILDPWERELTAGFLINRFRGNPDALSPAIDYLTAQTHKPVAGVIPFIPNLSLPDEDSVHFHSRNRFHHASRPDSVNLAIIKLPHGSNDTDFTPLYLEPDLNITLVEHPSELFNQDAILIPGSKCVSADLTFLFQSGLAQQIIKLAQQTHTEIMGICGGFQMLGSSVHDPLQIESSQTSIDGLALLPMTTTMAPQKTLRNTTATHVPSQLTLQGYEIHHGQTMLDGSLEPRVLNPHGEILGAGCHHIWGTYLHGIFDQDSFRRWWINQIRVTKQFAPLDMDLTRYQTHDAIDHLATIVRNHIEMKKIYQWLNL